MSKLFKLKKWLTIEDTAKHLTSIFDEPVKDYDVLRFALDGHLEISVNLVNHATARKCGFKNQLQQLMFSFNFSQFHIKKAA